MTAEDTGKTALAALRATVYGRVQGVFFRDFVQRWARGLGLTCYVRNLADGASVEVWAEGERQPLEVLLGHLGAGPPAARVSRVDTAWSVYTGGYPGFSIRY
ncbi:MAG: acylphosphatase [Chloroflexota bacterium]